MYRIITLLLKITLCFSEVPICVKLHFSCYPSLDNVKADTLLVAETEAHDRSTCARNCFEMKNCVTFQYGDGQSSCRTFSSRARILEGLSTTVAVGWVTYDTEERVEGQVFSPCEESAHCTENAECHQQICRCTIGYSYTRDRVCVQECASYGHEYTVYEERNVAYLNQVTLTDVTVQTCKDACTANSQCKSFDYGPASSSPKLCHLQYHNWLDVTASQQLTNNDYYYGHRNCEK